jgi:hypothetical protein
MEASSNQGSSAERRSNFVTTPTVAGQMDSDASDQDGRLAPPVSEESSDSDEVVPSRNMRNFFGRFGLHRGPYHRPARVSEQNRNQQPVAANGGRLIEIGVTEPVPEPVPEFRNMFQVQDLFVSSMCQEVCRKKKYCSFQETVREFIFRLQQTYCAAHSNGIDPSAQVRFYEWPRTWLNRNRPPLSLERDFVIVGQFTGPAAVIFGANNEDLHFMGRLLGRIEPSREIRAVEVSFALPPPPSTMNLEMSPELVERMELLNGYVAAFLPRAAASQQVTPRVLQGTLRPVLRAAAVPLLQVQF